MKTQHTRGLWTATAQQQVMAGSQRIADCHTACTTLTCEERDANADLIAASPELLHAAENLLRELRFAFDEVPAGVDAWMATLQSAIAKATNQ